MRPRQRALLRWMVYAGPGGRALRGAGARNSGVAHSRVVSVSAEVVVYRTRGPRADGFWTCSRTSNRFVLVGRDDSDESAKEECSATTTMSQFHVAGNWLIATHETGDNEYAGCTKYALSACPGPVDALVVVDVMRGLRGQLQRSPPSRPTRVGRSQWSCGAGPCCHLREQWHGFRAAAQKTKHHYRLRMNLPHSTAVW